MTAVREGEKCSTDITYTFYPDGTMDINVTFRPHSDNLRRAGLVCAINPSLDIVDYYAHGPYENYADRLDGAYVGRYSTTVDDMVEPYVKATIHRRPRRPPRAAPHGCFGSRHRDHHPGQGRILNPSLYRRRSHARQPSVGNERTSYSVLHLDAWTRGVVAEHADLDETVGGS